MTVRYLDDDATPGGNGTKWKPFNDLGRALAALKNWDHLKIADGDYTGGKTIKAAHVVIEGEGVGTVIRGGALFGLRTMADDTVVQKLRITGSGDAGFQAIGTQGVTLEKVTLDHNQGPGAYLAKGDYYHVVEVNAGYNGTTFVVPGHKPNGVGLSIMTPHSKTAGSDHTVHILVEGSTFHHNGGKVKSTEYHGLILDFMSQDKGAGRVANPFNYKQEIVVQYNDFAVNNKSGLLVHNADQRGWVNPGFITIVGNRAWNNGQENYATAADYRVNNSKGVNLVDNWAHDNGSKGDDHFSFAINNSSVTMEGNHGASGLLKQGVPTIKDHGGNIYDHPVGGYDWQHGGRAHWLEQAQFSNEVGVDQDLPGVPAAPLQFWDHL